MALLNLDIAAQIDINLLAGHSVAYTATFWQNAAKTVPLNITGTLKLVARNQVGVVVELPEGQGISKVNNQIVVSRTVAQNLFAKGTWQYEVRGDLPDGNSIPYMRGKIISNA